MIVAVDITPDPSLIDQADDLLIEVQGEQETGTTLFRSIARRTKTRAGYDHHRAQEIVDLFKTEMRLLKKRTRAIEECVSMATTQYRD